MSGRGYGITKTRQSHLFASAAAPVHSFVSGHSPSVTIVMTPWRTLLVTS